jgi:hypothetical protein
MHNLPDVKINCNLAHPPLFPISPIENACPFKTIALNFITKLPPSGEYNIILTITDIDCSKASIFLPSHKIIDLKGVATLYATHMTPHYGIPHKVISDWDVHFISKFTTDLCCLLDIHQNISTAYHPQTDRASKRTNQTLSNICKSSAALSRKIGMHGFPSLSTPRIPGLQHLQSKPHLTCSLATHHKSTSQQEKLMYHL